jgi:hypothetical protein
MLRVTALRRIVVHEFAQEQADFDAFGQQIGQHRYSRHQIRSVTSQPKTSSSELQQGAQHRVRCWGPFKKLHQLHSFCWRGSSQRRSVADSVHRHWPQARTKPVRNSLQNFLQRRHFVLVDDDMLALQGDASALKLLTQGLDGYWSEELRA